MAKIAVDTFGGMIPAVDRRLLPNSAAQESQNTFLYDGRLRAMRVPKSVYTLRNSGARKIYRIPISLNNPENIPNSKWLEFNSATASIVESPIKNTTNKRYYWAGDTPSPFEPRYTTRTDIDAGRDPLKLGVLPPVSSCTLGIAGGVSTTNETRSYCHTLVTALNEEGPPSVPTAATTGKIDATWTVTIPAVDSERGPAAKAVTGITKAASAVVTCVGHGYVVGNRIYFNGHTGMTQINGLYGTVTAVGGVNSFTVDIDSSAFGVWTAGGTAQLTYREIKYINLYRTVVSSQGVATYYYVTQVAVTATSYADTIASSVVSLNLPLSSQDYNAPTTLDGFAEMPNGIIIGWYKNQVYFCEPYKPHAWPAAYQAAVAFNIVGVGVVGQSAVICTEGIPYMCTGTHPSNMSITKIGAVAYPCAAQNSILSLPDGVYYASYQGIVSVGTGVPNVITAKLMNLENWTSLVAANKVNAAVYNNCYLGYSGYTSGAFEPTAFDNTAFVMDDLPDARAGFVIDFTDARVALNKVKFDYTKVANVQRDMWTTETFAIMNSRVYQMSLASTEDEGGYVWQSKDFRMDQPTNLSIGRIFWEQPPNITKPVTGTLKVYADGILVLSRSMPDNGAEFRLPSGRLYNFYSFRIEGNYRIHQFQFATSAKELRGM